MLEIDILRNSSQNLLGVLGVILEGLGVQMMPRRLLRLRPAILVLASKTSGRHSDTQTLKNDPSCRVLADIWKQGVQIEVS